MNSNLTQTIVSILGAGGSLADVTKELSARRDEILKAIEAGEIKADSDAVKELAELNIALGDV